MPYNNNAIPPPEEITGQATLPLARIKRIINQDEDIGTCSKNAALLITVATEMFIQYLAQQAYNVTRSERKPRRNIQYKDMANAVARIDNLEFLSDVVPRTVPFKEYKEKKAKDAVDQVRGGLGQTTIDNKMLGWGGLSGGSASHEAMDSEPEKMDGNGLDQSVITLSESEVEEGHVDSEQSRERGIESDTDIAMGDSVT